MKECIRAHAVRPRARDLVVGGFTGHCRWCGTAFTQMAYQNVYCSQYCEDKARQAHPDEKFPGRLDWKAVKFCPRCGQPFATWHEGQQYCSDKCRYHDGL